MTPDDWDRAKAILDGALERPPAERPQYVAAACAQDAAMRREVESLLEANENDWEFFDAPTAGWAPGTGIPEPPRRRLGERIGTYEILEELGRGGMGEVYLARRADDEFQKKVAIKLIRAGMANADALRRFRTERQISAALDHPGIARLLDGGTTESGEPYFVMEHVEGVPLLDYCRDRGLSIRDRLGLFRQICAAVHYAHQHLVVHRDLKPGNVLVSPEGAPKLLDFGIAKLLGAEAGLPAPEDTATLFRVLTPEYASPEQIRGRPITTASDVYSLGVVLYELLTGEKPYRIETGDPEELLRVVCESDPDRPSTRAAGFGGDLDAIVLRAMRKEPGLRYASADQLSEDIRRHLDGQPVQARRGTLSYRAGKFAHRHRLGLAAAVLVAIAVGGGIVATLREARRARRAEARAERRFNDVRRLANSFLFEFHDAIRDLPGTTAARALVVTRALEYLDSLAKESEGDRALRRELAEAYHRVGDAQGNPFMANLGDLRGAVASYGKAIALLEPDIAAADASDDERATLATAYLVGGSLRLNEGKPQVALDMARKGLALRQALAARAPDDTRRQMDLAQAWQFVAFDATAAGKKEEAVAALAAQASILEKRRSADPTDRAVRRSLAQNLFLSADALQNAGDPAQALEKYRQAAAIQEELIRDDPSSVTYRRDVAWSYVQIGNMRVALADNGTALEDYRRALAVFESLAAADAKSTDPVLGVALSHHNAGEALTNLGRRHEGLAEYRRARPAYEALVAAAPSNAWISGMLAVLYVRSADLEADSDRAAACALYGKGLALFQALGAGGGLAPDRAALFERAKAQAAACRD